MFIVDDFYDIINFFSISHRFFSPKYFLHIWIFNRENFHVLWLYDTVLSCQLLAQRTIHLGPPVIFIVMFEML